jgi:hypothetical protein
MRKPVTIRIHEQVIAAVNAEATKQERGFARVIENILSTHFGITGIQDDVEVIYAPEDIRSFELIRDERDTPEEHEELKKAIETMLKNAGY